MSPTKDLDHLTDEQLLDLRLGDLRLKIKGTPLEHRVAKLYAELNARGLPFKPHVWLSEEWFTPDGVSGFAIPFYLAHLEHQGRADTTITVYRSIYRR